MATRPKSVRTLLRKLYLRSKQKPESKFYSIYDKICRMDILEAAYAQCRANKGCPGIDGVSFQELEKKGTDGVATLLRGIQADLCSKQYKPGQIKRVLIAKSNGGQRPLGIATIRDRVVQMAITLVMQPIYDPHLHGDSYGYRPKRNALDAVRAINNYLAQGYRHVLDADLKQYFDSIPHEALLAKLERRISDHSILTLLRKILKSPIVEIDARGKTRVKPNKIGVPQGAAISPLLIDDIS